MILDDVKRVAVIGAGTMGAGIALSFAVGGFDVALYDVNSRQIDLGLQRIDKSLSLFTAEGLVEAGQADLAKRRIVSATDFVQTLRGVQFVIEVVPEDLGLKQKLWVELEKGVSAEVVLTSNTSGLSITAIASVCKNQERAAGMHWFNPPELVPLVEVTKGQKTAQATANLVHGLAKRLGKTPIMVKKDIPGFVGNRLQYALLREALHIVETGAASPQDVDTAVKAGIGFRWSWLGPLETADLGGLDIFHAVSNYLFKDLADDKKPQAFFTELIKSGSLGVKNGSGFYTYTPQDKDKILSRRDRYFARQQLLIAENFENSKA
jgi:3-hydroxybutyryl-CoA dehydrogenase